MKSYEHAGLHSRTRWYHLFITSAVLSLVVATGCPPPEQVTQLPPPPETRTDDVVDVIHGVEVPDPYRWLEDQEAPETREWIDAQNAYTDTILGELPVREELIPLLTKLMMVDSVSFPSEYGGRYFFSKRKADQDLSIIYMREGRDGEDEVLIDPHPMSEDHTTSVYINDITDDGKLLAYGVRRGGVDETSVGLYDVDARQPMDEGLPEARYFSVGFSKDKSGLFYSKHAAEGGRIFYHAFGTPPEEDKLVFGEGYGPEKILFQQVSDDGRWLIVHVAHGSSGQLDVFLIDISQPRYRATALVEGIPNEFNCIPAGPHLLISTNWEAPNGRVFLVDPTSHAMENWKELIPERADATLQSVSPAGGYVFVKYLKDVKSLIEIYDLEGNKVREIEFETIGSSGNVSGRWESNEGFYSFTSFHVPTTVYRYDIETGEQDVWDKVEIPVDTSGYVVKQEWFASKDGTKVPIFVVHNKGLELDGTNPTLIYGYGGFRASMTPYFSADAVAWVEEGGVYAVVCLRGGSEFGEKWHEAGMLDKKQNVFDDFIAAGEYLVAQGYTSPEHLGAMGGSNGGLLMGAMLTQKPDLFKALVCTYPLLDMVRYHMFMVAKWWVPEYGSSEDPEQFQYILAYSPYHNVKEGVEYPAILFITGDGDTRVAPLHARKMTALMQAKTGSKINPVLLRYHTKAGHSGGQPMSEQINNSAESLSFLLWQLREDGGRSAAIPSRNLQ